MAKSRPVKFDHKSLVARPCTPGLCLRTKIRLIITGHQAIANLPAGIGFAVLCSAAAFVRRSFSALWAKRYGLAVKSNQLGSPIANDPAFFDMNDCVYRPERPLGIPTIRDRVIQTAAKIVIEPIFEADFEDNAYGYRPARGAVDAVRKCTGIYAGHPQGAARYSGCRRRSLVRR
jgi:hypothetical protein